MRRCGPARRRRRTGLGRDRRRRRSSTTGTGAASAGRARRAGTRCSRRDSSTSRCNGLGDVDLADRRPGRDQRSWPSCSRARGVTSFCPTVDQPGARRLPAMVGSDRSRRAPRAGARRRRRASVLGAHLEGPFLGDAPGAHPRDAAPPGRRRVDRRDLLADARARSPMVTLAPEADPQLALATLLASSWGHRRARPFALRPSRTPPRRRRPARRVVTHLFNGMGGLDHREPGLAGRRARRRPSHADRHRRSRARAPAPSSRSCSPPSPASRSSATRSRRAGRARGESRRTDGDGRGPPGRRHARGLDGHARPRRSRTSCGLGDPDRSRRRHGDHDPGRAARTRATAGAWSPARAPTSSRSTRDDASVRDVWLGGAGSAGAGDASR